MQNAIDSKVAGLAVTLSNADAVIPVAKKAADAGIPVVAFNQGIDDYKEAGAKMYFGSDEQLAGQTVGQKLAAEDRERQDAVHHPGAGLGRAGDPLRRREVDLPEHREPAGQRGRPAVGAADHPVEAGAGPVDHQHRDPGRADRAGGDAGPGGGGQHQAKIATFDLNQDAAQAIKDGKILFSVDQQPYVQGYMAVASLWLNLTNGNDIGGGKPVLTGPSIVDSTNIDQILPYTANNKR